MNKNINDKIYDKSNEINFLWTQVDGFVNSGKTFNEIHEQNKESFIYYFNKYKDKEGWTSIDEMITTIAAKLKLTGWNQAYAIKAVNERNKVRYSR